MYQDFSITIVVFAQSYRLILRKPLLFYILSKYLSCYSTKHGLLNKRTNCYLTTSPIIILRETNKLMTTLFLLIEGGSLVFLKRPRVFCFLFLVSRFVRFERPDNKKEALIICQLTRGGRTREQSLYSTQRPR